MLERDQISENFGREVERYLAETLHVPVRLRQAHLPGNLPSFLSRTYDFFEADIAHSQCIFLIPEDDDATPADVAKHLRLVTEATGEIAIYAARSISSYNRSRYVGQGVPFIVPGNQLYIPQLALDLREYFRAPRSRSSDGLSPAAQAVFFYHLLGRGSFELTPTEIANRLQYSAMTIGRAFDDLVAVGLAKSWKDGRERFLAFKGDRRSLFEGARTLLRSPVRSTKYVCAKRNRFDLKLAGESALAALTNLGSPRLETYAIPASDWKALSKEEFFVVEPEQADFAVETWSYDPAGLSERQIVDPLSLYAQFWDHRDERVSMAADQLLEEVSHGWD